VKKLFPSIDVEQAHVSVAQARAMSDAQRRDMFTGAVEFSCSGGKTIHLIVTRGQIVNAYMTTAEGCATLHADDWYAAFSQETDCEVRSLILTPNVLRYTRILLEQTPSQTLAFSDIDLDQLIRSWIDREGASLIWLIWPGADGLISLTGGGVPVADAVFLGGDQILQGAAALSALLGWKESQCTIHWYDGHRPVQAWSEYHLHRAFRTMSQKLITRYGELTGRVMVNIAARELNFTATTNGWNISILGGTITDQAIFPDADTAAHAYRLLLQGLVHHTQTMIGSGMINLIFREIASQFDSATLEAVRTYTLIPEMLIAGAVKAR
jgi:hypothetical protein